MSTTALKKNSSSTVLLIAAVLVFALFLLVASGQRVRLVNPGLAIIALLMIAGYLRGTNDMAITTTTKNNMSLSLLAVAVCSALLFFVLPKIIFDDTAIVLRYMDFFSKGYFFRYNIADPPVYGISGFVHGLLGGLLSYLHIFNSENALLASNFIGFTGSSAFIFLIFNRLLHKRSSAFLATVMAISTARSFLIMGNAGLETPLHLAFVLGGIYWFLTGKMKLFWLFAALMIISKLDAVPIVITLTGYYFVVHYRRITTERRWGTELIGMGLFFVIPLAAGLTALGLLFGSPLPQSAFSKLYFHRDSSKDWFPFLSYFTRSAWRFAILLASLTYWVWNAIQAFRRKEVALLLNGVFGSLFLASMALYYVYNPQEKMIWYYAMPELFLVLQFLFAIFYHLLNPSVAAGRYWNIAGVGLLFAYCSISWRSIAADYLSLEDATRYAEGERTYIGKLIAGTGSAKDTLLSSHGLPTRFFKGYVLDLSGLNSSLTTRYRLRADSIITIFKPTLIINHAFPESADLLDHYNYAVEGIFRNINFYNAHSWILVRRSEGKINHRIRFLDKALNAGNYREQNGIIHCQAVDGHIVLRDTFQAASKQLHVGILEKADNHLLRIYFYNRGKLLRYLDYSPRPTAFYPAKLNDVVIDASGADVVMIVNPRNKSFEITEPIYELKGFE